MSEFLFLRFHQILGISWIYFWHISGISLACHVFKIHVTLHNISLPGWDQGRSSGEPFVEAARRSDASTQAAGTPGMGLKGVLIMLW